MRLIHLDLKDNGEIHLLQQYFEFKGMKLNKNNCKFSFKNIESGENEEVLVDYDEALFTSNIIAHLDVISFLMLNFEEFIPDSTLIKSICKFDYLDADVELDDIEKQMQEYNNNSTLTIVERTEHILEHIQLSDYADLKKVLSLIARLRITSIQTNGESLRMKASRYRNESTIQDETFFFPSDKGTEISYLKIGIGAEWVNEDGDLCIAHSRNGEFTPFYLELHEQFKSIEQHAFLFLSRKIKKLSPLVNGMSLTDSIEEINGEIGGASSDPQPAILF